jgi:hypothetical protein
MKELKISIDEVKKVLEREFGIKNVTFMHDLNGNLDSGYDNFIDFITGDVNE